jgi:hypothetical protein
MVTSAHQRPRGMELKSLWGLACKDKKINHFFAQL